jgi:hypothetical protein
MRPPESETFQRKQFMNRSKRRSCRLALSLLCIGVRPCAAGLNARYNALEPGHENSCARAGGSSLLQLIKEEGSIAKAIDTLTNPVVVQETRNVPLVVALIRAQAREEAFKYISQALVCTHAALALLPDGERLSQAFLAPLGNGLKRFGEGCTISTY